MATISSAGLGSGLDVNSIVTQLVAIEKQPLTKLALQATKVQSQVSAFGRVQSMFSALTDVATRISVPSTWGARNATSSLPGAATITATVAASANTFSLDVDQLALPQSVSSAQLAPGAVLGAGNLTLRLGSWAPAAGASPAAFAPVASSSDVSISVTAGDTLATLAGKINSLTAGVVATVFNDGSQERLLMRSKDTGASMGFRLQSSDPGLSSLVFDPQSSPNSGMASTGIPVQWGQDAKARINGLSVSSASNTLQDNFPGVTITLLSTTTSAYGSSGEGKAPLTMSLSEDVTPAVKNVSDFVSAYNDLNKTLADLTKYDASTQTAGLFQGDSSVLGLQNILRSVLGSSSLGSSTQTLSDMGLQRQLDGSLTINTAKLSLAANNGTSLQQLFTNNNNNTLTNGFALKIRDLGLGLLASGGALPNKLGAIQTVLLANTKAQAKVTDHVTLYEARIRKQYSSLDAQMAKLNALNAYVTQQVATWNKSSA